MIEIIFISSSRIKFAHIEYGLEGSNYFITPQRNYGIGYEEPRIYDREQLLKESYIDAKKRFKKNVSNTENKFFILEDTSVIIDALSDDKNEIPGLDIKYWMQENSFHDIDTLLKKMGNNRACTVRSDILLHLPKNLQEKYRKEYIIFTGTQKGFICKQEKVFKTNPLYPWLDNKTFNKWFVPEKYKNKDIPISQLKIQDAKKYDFRLNALNKMISFLDGEQLDDYSKKNKIHHNIPSLFDATTFILLGSTCAGKSTLADYMAKHYQYYHIEASDFMYLEYHKKHGVNPNIAIGDFAQKVLEENPIIVAKKVVEFCKKLDSIPIVISGFRTIDEVNYFQKNHLKNVKSLYIDTKQKLRYERCKLRNRSDVAISWEKFQNKDRQQYDIGIRILEESIKDKISNNNSVDKYFKTFEISFHDFIRNDSFHSKKKIKNMRLEDLILITLSNHSDSYYTTTEIAKLLNEKFSDLKPKSKNNISRYFNQYFHPYYEIISENKTNKYKINTTGLSHAKYLQIHN